MELYKASHNGMILRITLRKGHSQAFFSFMKEPHLAAQISYLGEDLPAMRYALFDEASVRHLFAFWSHLKLVIDRRVRTNPGYKLGQEYQEWK